MPDLTPSVRVVTLTQRDLEALIARVVASTLAERQRVQAADMGVLSPRQVARLAKIRDERVYAAIEGGKLEAYRDAAGRYRVSAETARAWIASLAVYGR